MRYGTIYADPAWPERGGGKRGGRRGANAHYAMMTVREICALQVRELAAPNCHLYLWTTNRYMKEAMADVIPAWGFRYVTKIGWYKEGKPGLGQYFRGKDEVLLFAVRGAPPYRTLPDGKRAQGTTAIEAPQHYADAIVAMADAMLEVDGDHMTPFIGEHVSYNGLLEISRELYKRTAMGDGPFTLTEQQIRAARAAHSVKPNDVVIPLIEKVSAGPYIELFRRGDPAPGWHAWGNETTSARWATEVLGAPRAHEG